MANEQRLATARQQVDTALAGLRQAEQSGDVEAIRAALHEVDAAGHELDEAENNHNTVSAEVVERKDEYQELVKARKEARKHETAEQKAKRIIKEHDGEENDGEEPDWQTRLEHSEEDAHEREELLTH